MRSTRLARRLSLVRVLSSGQIARDIHLRQISRVQVSYEEQLTAERRFELPEGWHLAAGDWDVGDYP